jgi:hypothetical protein
MAASPKRLRPSLVRTPPLLWTVAALLWGALTLHFAHCKSHKPEQPSHEDAGAQASTQPHEPLDPGIGRTAPRVAGTMDVDNRYLSTVMVTTEAHAQIAHCSGVIIHPRLVLTAASCLCTPPEETAHDDTLRNPASRGTSCMKRAFVRTVRYGQVADKDFKEETTAKRFDTYEGAVRLHPEFRPLLDSHGSAVAYEADLALILLDTEVKEGPGPVNWTKSEAQAGEWLVMAGYGQDNAWGGYPGVRYFRRNKVTRVLAEPEGQVLYEQQGAFLYNGYAGGPCFREEGSTRWLVGIASIGTDTVLSFTSLLPFQDWLRAEN